MPVQVAMNYDQLPESNASSPALRILLVTAPAGLGNTVKLAELVCTFAPMLAVTPERIPIESATVSTIASQYSPGGIVVFAIRLFVKTPVAAAIAPVCPNKLFGALLAPVAS